MTLRQWLRIQKLRHQSAHRKNRVGTIYSAEIFEPRLLLSALSVDITGASFSVAPSMGSQLELSATVSGSGSYAYSWDLNTSDGLDFADAFGDYISVDWTSLAGSLGYSAGATYGVAVAVSDGTESATSTVNIEVGSSSSLSAVMNSAAFSVDPLPGSSLSLGVSASGSSLTYSWDLDTGDGLGFNDAYGDSPVIDWSDLDADHGYLPDGTYGIAVRVSDGTSDVTATGSVAVNSSGGGGGSSTGTIAPAFGAISWPDSPSAVPPVIEGLEAGGVMPSAFGFTALDDTSNSLSLSIWAETESGTTSWTESLSSTGTVSGLYAFPFQFMSIWYEDSPPSDPYAVTLTLSDESGSTTSSGSVFVHNAAPSAESITIQSFGRVNPGDSVSIGATLRDRGISDSLTIEIDWGNGDISPVPGSFADGSTVSTSYSYSETGYFPVTLNVTDDDGDMTSIPAGEISVEPDLAPYVDSPSWPDTDTSTPQIQEGTAGGQSLAFNVIDDHYDGLPVTVTLDTNSGTTTWTTSLNSFSTLSTASPYKYQYPLFFPAMWIDDARGETFNVSLEITDPAGNSAEESGDVYVHNVAPSVQLDPFTSSTHTADTPVVLTGSLSDQSPDDELDLTIDWGDGTITTLPQDSQSFRDGDLFTASHLYCERATPYTIQAEVFDDDGGAGIDLATVLVGSGIPDTTAPWFTTLPYVTSPVTEAVDFDLQGSVDDDLSSNLLVWLDLSLDSWSYSSSAVIAAGDDFSFRQMIPDDFPTNTASDAVTATVGVRDAACNVATYTFVFNVANVRPNAQWEWITYYSKYDPKGEETVDEVTIGELVSLGVNVIDAGDEPFGWADMGDGNTMVPPVWRFDNGDGSYTLVFEHIYLDNGDYTVTIDVWDDDEPLNADTIDEDIRVVPEIGLYGHLNAVESTGDGAVIAIGRTGTADLPESLDVEVHVTFGQGVTSADFTDPKTEGLINDGPTDTDDKLTYPSDRNAIDKIVDGAWVARNDTLTEGVEEFKVKLLDGEGYRVFPISTWIERDGIDGAYVLARQEVLVKIYEELTLFGKQHEVDGSGDADENDVDMNDVRQHADANCSCMGALALYAKRYPQMRGPDGPGMGDSHGHPALVKEGTGEWLVNLYVPVKDSEGYIVEPPNVMSSLKEWSVSMELNAGNESPKFSGDYNEDGAAEIWPWVVDQGFRKHKAYLLQNGFTEAELTQARTAYIIFSGENPDRSVKLINPGPAAIETLGQQLYDAFHDNNGALSLNTMALVSTKSSFAGITDPAIRAIAISKLTPSHTFILQGYYEVAGDDDTRLDDKVVLWDVRGEQVIVELSVFAQAVDFVSFVDF